MVAALAATLWLAGCATGQPDRTVGSLQTRTLSAVEVSPPRSPGELIGAAPERLLAALGQPKAQRRERPAEVWQYEGGDCVLDVFFYAVTADDIQVVHVEARDGAAHATDVAPCLNGVLQARVDS
ncbi:hypothetical protein [Algihabitans albus]|uniref:hypothetical protein n=1 Tax=Algihabitans albus TaxID=2164067 RepID=UPI000E5CFF95|nr:hypothetical protein [Algihabitans albus]